MSKYALWNNKGGVGKSFLTFSLACEYAIENPDEQVLVLDLCPQANLTEMLLGGKSNGIGALNEFYSAKPRRSVGGYFEARLTSPFIALQSISEFLYRPVDINENIPENLTLLPGDNLLELLSEAIRQASQMALPAEAWAKVMRWLNDLIKGFEDLHPDCETTIFLDCNPSFSIYTQIALASAEFVLVPFTADDSSRRGIENVFALLYGIASNELEGYARLSFSKKASDENVELPKLHSFVSNRVTMYKGKPSSAFEAKSAPIKSVVESSIKGKKKYVVNRKKTEDYFANMPDYHSVAVVASSEGCPLSKLKAGHHQVDEDVVQVNQTSIDRYTKAIGLLVSRL